MKNIIFCDNSLRELVNFREDVFNAYAKAGYNVHLIAPKNIDYAPLFPNIKLIPIHLSRGGMNPISELHYLLNLIYLYRTIKPVFIFHYTVKPNIYGSFAAWLSRTPSACMIAGLGFLFSASGIKASIGRTLYKLAMKIPCKIFVLNEMNKQLLIEKKLATHEQIVFLRGGEGINLKKFN